MNYGRYAALSLLGLALLSGLASCATGAVGVNECREIESLRCEYGATCGIVEDVAACVRFYDDQCLHGFESKRAPAATEQKKCLDTLNAAGACAEKSTKGLATS